MQKRKIVPSFLTSMNLLCGFWAILINEPTWSFYLILIAIAFDFVDGLSARVLKVPSLFGKELDSLADMVSFGVAPGFLYYHHVLKAAAETQAEFYFHLFVATLVPVLAGLRLAKFNVKDSGKKCFSGLPSSAAALFIVSVPFLVSSGDLKGLANWMIILLPIAVGLLMVSKLPMFSFKNIKEGLVENSVQLIYLASIIGLGVFLYQTGRSVLLGIPISIVWYIVLSGMAYPFLKGRQY